MLAMDSFVIDPVSVSDVMAPRGFMALEIVCRPKAQGAPEARSLGRRTSA